jgi:hypothetical protein
VGPFEGFTPDLFILGESFMTYFPNNSGSATPADDAATGKVFNSKGQFDPQATNEVNRQILGTVIYTDATGIPQSTVKTSANSVVHAVATQAARATAKNQLFK